MTKKNGSGGKNKAELEIRMQKSFESKNKAMEFSVFCETSSNLSSNLRELKQSKRKLFRDFTDDHCDSNRQYAKDRYAEYADAQN